MLKEFESKPIKGLQPHTCGTCKHHLPSGKRVPSSIKKGKGKGKPAYWLCKCEGATNFGEGRVCEDGCGCKHWENRYESDEAVKEWIKRIHAPRKKAKPRHNRKRPRKSIGRWEAE